MRAALSALALGGLLLAAVAVIGPAAGEAGGGCVQVKVTADDGQLVVADRYADCQTDEADDVTISYLGGSNYLVTGPPTGQADAELGCSGNSPVTCTGADSIQVYAAGGNDKVTLDRSGPDAIPATLLTAVHGGDGNDRLSAGASASVLSGNAGKDTLLGFSGQDILVGGAGGDKLLGGAHADQLDGGPGGDRLNGGVGRDLFHGGGGRDHVNARDHGRDRLIDCGPGADRLRRDANLDPAPQRC